MSSSFKISCQCQRLSKSYHSLQMFNIASYVSYVLIANYRRIPETRSWKFMQMLCIFVYIFEHIWLTGISIDFNFHTLRQAIQTQPSVLPPNKINKKCVVSCGQWTHFSCAIAWKLYVISGVDWDESLTRGDHVARLSSGGLINSKRWEV